MKKSILLSMALLFISMNFINAQSVEELTKQKEAKAAELAKLEPQLADISGKVDGLKGEIAALTDQLTPYPRWDKGVSGNIGLNFSNFNKWLSKDAPNTNAALIGIAMGGFVNGDFKKSFWRNGVNVTLAWQKFDNKDVPSTEENEKFQVGADAFNISSLFGYKLNEKLAVSTLGEYRTALLDGKFNDPGYLDLGAGATWTPIKDMVIVFHPLNYNFVFSSGAFDYESSLGCKVVGDYHMKITNNLAWKTNVSGFFSYKDSDLHNWTWVNGFSTAVNGIGIGVDVGFRKNKQEALAGLRTDNPLQTYWLLGLSYAISSK